ncbi:hypothetical protein [Kitasatospora acidiphila]|uniref:hypothetical protein n=1 Tax=Kitasatospora acidiphila TaxID=2567942 RepID=UPI003C730A4D
MSRHFGNVLISTEIAKYCDDLLLAVPYAGTICVDPSTMGIVGYLEGETLDAAGLDQLIRPVSEGLSQPSVGSSEIEYSCLIRGERVPVAWHPQAHVTEFMAGRHRVVSDDMSEAEYLSRLIIMSSRSRAVFWALEEIKTTCDGITAT